MTRNAILFGVKCFSLAVVLSCFILVPGKVLYADIIVAYNGSGGFFGSVNTRVVGQTFLADSSVEVLETMSFFYVEGNNHLSAASVTIDLFQGEGYGGALVDSQTKTATKGIGNYWEDFDFSGNTLVPGQVYSWRLSGGPGAGGNGNGVTYADGTRLDSSGNPISGDLAFRVLGSPIPEPSGLVLAGLGLLAIACGRRRRR